MKKESYNILWHALEKIEFGALKVKLPDGGRIEFKGANQGVQADIHIKDWRVIDMALLGGDIAFGESYMENLWQTSDLPALLTFFASNSQALESFFHANKFNLALFFVKNLFNKNSKSGSKKNIQYHYDLGNDFYSLWLDETMTYSSAIYHGRDCDIKEAQKNKYQRILSKISAGNILEIGCGWGGFAEEAAGSGAEISCLTLSPSQAQYAKERLKNKNLQHKAEIKLQDYRDEKNLYQNIVSIEMFEAVGREYWDQYFGKISSCLKKDGKAVIQTITIDDQVYKKYKKRGDFIQKHIFPGGFLPSDRQFEKAAEKSNLKIEERFAFGEDYKKTLAHWLNNFDGKVNQVKSLGFSEEFIRKWRFYLSYCIAGFASARTNVVQYQLTHNL
jgi:cyclopropane-fatty-acyl-phospholipid synthase